MSSAALCVRVAWPATDEAGNETARSFLSLLEGMVQADPRLTDWKAGALVRKKADKPLLTDLSLASVEGLLREGAVGDVRVDGALRSLGSLVSGWTEGDGWKAAFTVTIGCEDVGTDSPNNLELRLSGDFSYEALSRIFEAVVRVTRAQYGDVTTRPFLAKMMAGGETIFVPSGGWMAYVRDAFHADIPGIRTKDFQSGSLLSIGEDAFSDVDLTQREPAIRLHAALKPWRDSRDPSIANRERPGLGGRG